MSNLFVQAFVSVFSASDIKNPMSHQQCETSINYVDFSVSDVEFLLKSLNTDSAMGPDNINPMLMNKCSSSLAYPFYLLFKNSLSTGTISDS